MSVPYGIVKQIHPPTSVEHSCYCHFYNLEDKNLVVAGTTQLRVFRLIPDPDGSDGTPAKVKLECMQTFTFHGSVMSMQSVYLSGFKREALFLSFKDAKLSLMEYDPSTHDLRILSMHYFEDDEEMKKGEITNYHVPVIRIDPDNRCAVALIYGKNIVVLPFCKDIPTDDSDCTPLPSKSPVMASYTIRLAEIDEKLANIVDVQFLHGYYEPTLLILYEPIKTWSGRIAVRQDTCSIVALSLNIYQRVHPTIWSQSSMPFDCFQALPVPKPLGGVLVLAVNSLLYLNQSVPPYGVSLSSFTDYSTAFPLKSHMELKISLDCAQACFIAFDKLVVSLKNGDIYVVTLINDGMRCVRNFHFEKAASSVLTCCMTVCDDNFLFLGSRLGNSILLHYARKTENAVPVPPPPKPEERPVKRARLDLAGEWMATDVALIEDPDELEVYGSESQATKELVSYAFEVCDTLLNIGPCAKFCMGEPAFLSEEFSNANDHDLEVVTTSGYGKNGALSILQRSVRPQVVTTFELPGVEMFTVIGLPHKAREEEEVQDPPPAEERQADIVNSHAFLILSRATTTMILQTGQEINELDHSGFSTQSPTVFAANLGNNRFILQVSPMGVRLLAGSKQLQHIPLDVGSPIVWASVADPYAVILSDEGLLIQLTLKLDASGTSARLAISRPQLNASKSRVLTLCLYKDVSGIFTTAPKMDAGTAPKNTSRPSYSFPVEAGLNQPPVKEEHVDEEDALLYGDTVEHSGPRKKEAATESSTNKQKAESKDVAATYWLFVSRDNGAMEIYSLPDFKIRFLVKNFAMANTLLVDSVQSAGELLDKTPTKHEAAPAVKEILVVGLGANKARPLLLARCEEDVVLYEAFPFFEYQVERRLKLRFKKVPHEMILRNWRSAKGGAKLEAEDVDKTVRLRWLRHFDDISGYSGVFICGRYPHWIFMTSRGELRVHPMEIDKPVVSFAPFHNINCPNGFLYFTGQGDLRICVLPTHLSYDAPWPVRKVPLRCNPHFVNYHAETKTYCVVTSTLEPCTRIVKSTGDEKEFEAIERDERYIYPQMERFSLQLFSPVIWEPIPGTRIELEEWEHVTCLKNVLLSSEGTRSGLKGYLALGTNICHGEDVTNRGRILILDIIEVVPEPGQPLTKNKIKVIYDKEQKGPVTEVCQISGFLLSAIGQKIYIWQLRDNELVGIAFIDTQIYIHHIITLKNLILIADVYKSISLLRFQESSRTLSLVSKDYRPMQVFSTDFFVDNSLLAFVATDADQNVLVYTYQPEARESMGGHRLLRKCDFNLGFHVNAMFRVKCRTADVETWDKNLSQFADRRHVIYAVTLDGSLHFILPLSEKVYRRLHMLQNMLTSHLQHVAGLNPKSHRLCKFSWRALTNPVKAILDGDLMWKYLNLSITEKAEIAKKSASTPDQIIEDLLELNRYTSHF